MFRSERRAVSHEPVVFRLVGGRGEPAQFDTQIIADFGKGVADPGAEPGAAQVEPHVRHDLLGVGAPADAMRRLDHRAGDTEPGQFLCGCKSRRACANDNNVP